MDERFWDFAVGLWRHAEVEQLALSIQREHGAVVHFLLGAWLAQTGQAFDAALAEKALTIIAPVERALTVLRQQRADLEGEAKQEVLRQELAHEKELYLRLAELVPAAHSPQGELAFVWWSFFFPRVLRTVQEDWWAILAPHWHA